MVKAKLTAARMGRMALAAAPPLLIAVAVAALLAGPTPALADGRGALLLVVGLLTIALPLNGLAVRRAIKRDAIDLRQAPRPLIYANTAALWALIGIVAIVGLAQPNGWASLAPLDWPTTPAALSGVAIALAAPMAMAAWAHDLRRNRRKRARLRLLYRGGLRAVAPQSPAELRAFRAATVVSSIGEEIAYRLALLFTLAAWIGPAPAALASSLVFALGHIYQGWTAAALTGAFGLAAAALTLVTGSVWPALVLHVAWNQAAGGALYAVYQPGIIRVAGKAGLQS